jgi:uncharacterized membrane protein
MLAASAFMLVFRLLHILAGAFWFGAAVLFTGFIGPAAAEVGPAAGPLLANVVAKRHVAKIITSAGGVTVLAGLFIYWHDWHLYRSFGDWIGSSFGIVLTIGAVAAILAAVEGSLLVGRNVERLVEVGGRLAEAQGPPPAELLERFGKLQQEIKRASITDLVLLVIAVSAMATARYW